MIALQLLRLLIKVKLFCISMLCIFSTAVMAAELPENITRPKITEKIRAKQNIPLIPFTLGGTGTIFLSDQAINYAYQNDDHLLKINTGLYNGGRTIGLTGVEAATMLDNETAFGINMMLSADKSDVVLSAIHGFKDSGLQVRGTFSYMQGHEKYDFYRSSERAKLSQNNYYLSLSKINDSASNLGVHSFSMSVWEARAKNHSIFDSRMYLDQTPDYFLATIDRRCLSEGLLRGASVDFQYVPFINLVLAGTVGMEQVKFPLSNGSKEKKSSPLVDGKLNYTINDRHSVGIGYKYGVSEKGARAEWQCPAGSISAYNYSGKSGVSGNRSINFSVDILSLLSKQKKRGNASLAASMRPKADDATRLLQKAASRPTQLPSNFLVKVDPTAVSQIKIYRDPNIADVVIENGSHTVVINLGFVGINIIGINVNGAPVVNNGLFVLANNQLRVNSSNLPMPARNVHAYALTIVDAAGGNHIITFDVENT